MAVTPGLSVSRIVNVTTTLSPTAAIYQNFGALLVLGSSPVIDINERMRPYTTLTGVASDFGTSSPEYLAADLFFSQVPQPAYLMIGRWAQNATPGLLHGATLTPSQQILSNFTSIANGSFEISIDGVPHAVTGLSFSGALNLNNVAALIQADLPAGCHCVWNPVYGRFTIVSGTTGAASSVSYGSTASSGTDISTLLGVTQASGASPLVPGLAAESLLNCVSALANASNQWYGLTVATATPPSDADHEAVAAFIEGAGLRVYGITITNTSVLDPTNTSDLASVLKSLGYKRTFTQYSSSSPYAVCSLYGRAFTVDFTANNTTITLKFKQEPGVEAEFLTESQADALEAKNCNVFVAYCNGTAFIEQGVMANGFFFDEVHGTDWLSNTIQVDEFNVLYQSTTKVPQTDAGVHQLVTSIKGSCAKGVNNGLVAPGQWNGPSFGSLKTGDVLPTGYYVFAPLVATQSQADRETRKAPPIQVAVKLAGAVHSSDVLVTVNR